MCGIVGFVNWHGHQSDQARARLKHMADQLAHRGPDADGYWVDQHAALGHRRLSVIDLEGGQQPMSTADQALTISYNGEVYNYRQLRAELEQRGHVFRTRSDTEVILLGYREWGAEVLDRLNGMFALAIWNPAGQELFLARDRVGKKPLYIAESPDGLAFASELKGLRGGGFVGNSLDVAAVDCYFTLGFIPAPKSIIQGISKLPPAHYMLASRNAMRSRRYWHLSFDYTSGLSGEDAVEAFEEVFDDAVKVRMISDVPIGAFLSGGIDSGLVVSSMAKVSNRPVVTQSVGFEDRRYSELDAARLVAEHFGTDHSETIVKADAVDVLDQIVWHLDEPLGDPSSIPTWHVCQATRARVTVALSGDGGDEGFGGYTFRYLPHVFESKIRAALPASLRAAAFAPLGRIWPRSPRLPKALRLATILENLATSDAEAYFRDLSHLSAECRQRLYSSDFQEALGGFSAQELVHTPYRDSGANTPLGRARAADIDLYMADDVLAKVDRMSMAHSLEVRCPLLDYRVLEYASAMRDSELIQNLSGKRILRKVASRRLPATLSALPKRGFSIPHGEWLRGQLRPMFEHTLLRSASFTRDLLEYKHLRQLWLDHLTGEADNSSLLWSVLMLGLWLDCSVARSSQRAA